MPTASLTPSTTAIVLVSPPCFSTGIYTDRCPSTRTTLVWICCESLATPMSATRTGASPTVFSGRSLISATLLKLAVGVNVVIQGPDLNVARRQNQVRVVHRPNHIHQAQLCASSLYGSAYTMICR